MKLDKKSELARLEISPEAQEIVDWVEFKLGITIPAENKLLVAEVYELALGELIE